MVKFITINQQQRMETTLLTLWLHLHAILDSTCLDPIQPLVSHLAHGINKFHDV